ncbi:cold-shock protein [Bacillus sp. FJAT-52991]|uniref:Cold-shock protein n=1 Tax=Bacillus kandeliae TaxID=3129297 RepID=A0ABZ2N1V2_9BACI
MSYYNNRRTEPLPSEDVATWECVAQDCNGWMRKDFATKDAPPCPFCGSEMKTGTRHITALKNNNLHK